MSEAAWDEWREWNKSLEYSYSAVAYLDFIEEMKRATYLEF